MTSNHLYDWANSTRERFKDSGSISELETSLSQLESNQDHLKALQQDLSESKKMDLVLDYVSENGVQNLAAVFDCSYMPQLSFEIADFIDHLPSIKLPHQAHNYARAVSIIRGTAGIKDPSVMALFPENYKEHLARAKDVVFYFADKFSNRNKDFTLNALKKYDTSGFFEPLQKLSHSESCTIVSNWVHLHEHFHRTGALPLPFSLYEKSSTLTAGVEELRVDLKSMAYCLEETKGLDNYYLTFLFILAERLVGYPLFRDLDTNFDAYSSLIFMHHLQTLKVVQFNERELLFQSELYHPIRKLAQIIETTESEAAQLTEPKHRKRFLQERFESVLRQAAGQKETFRRWNQ